jgi:hypothetical protein
MNINLHIERLILHGLPASHAQGPVIGAAVQTELTRLLRNGGPGLDLQSNAAWPAMPVSTVQLASGEPAQVGQQIAHAVYQGIGQEQLSASRPHEGSTRRP